MDKKLIMEASITNDFDEAFEKMSKGFGIDDVACEPNFSIEPNVPEVRRIMKQSNVKYYEFGLWIVTDKISLDDVKYDHENSVFDALNKSDLYPYYGQNTKFTDYIEIW
jgi:hypothetical protein